MLSFALGGIAFWFPTVSGVFLVLFGLAGPAAAAWDHPLYASFTSAFCLSGAPVHRGLLAVIGLH